MPHRQAARPDAAARVHGRRPACGLVAALLLVLLGALALPAGPAAAQGFNLDRLFGAQSPDPAPGGEDAAAPAPPARDRPPELAAYGQLEGYEPGNSVVRRTTENVGVFRQRLRRVLREAPHGWSDMTSRLEALSPDGTAGYFAGVALVTAVLILIGRGVVVLMAVYAFLPLMNAAQRGGPPVGISGKLPVLALRFGVTVFALAVNALVAVGLGLWLVEDHPPTQFTALILIGAYAIYALVDVVWRMAICPYLTAYRVPALTDVQARRLYLWMTSLAAFGICGSAWKLWLRELGVSGELVALNEAVIGFGATVLTLAMLRVNRAGITRAILHGRRFEDVSWISALGARSWGPVVALYVLAAGLEGTVRVVLGLDQGVTLLSGLFITLMLGLVVYAVGIFAVERLFARARAAAATRAEAEARDRAELAAATEDEAEAAQRRARAADPGWRPEEAASDPAPDAGDRQARAMGGESGEDDGGDDGDEGGGRSPAPPPAAEPATAPPAPPRGAITSYEALAARVVSLFALGVAAYVLARIWLGEGAFAEGTPIERAEGVLDTLLIGYVVYHATRIWLDRKIADEGGPEAEPEPGDEGGGASAASRLATLLPLFRSVILVTIGVSVLLLVAVEFGVNVAPLFAGAGIVGIAIGFGAQTLVRDILSGMFFLIDDAFRKGEYIDVGQVKGVVEKISLRSFQLRHHLGALHTIPFGEIHHLTNFSRDWVMMKLPLRVTYDTDVERVRKLVKQLGQELLEHPTEGPKFLQPLKSQGVYMMDDSAMIVRVKYMTRPGDQWTTRKMVYQRIREIFEREGIKFAHREVTVHIPDLPKDRSLSEGEAAAVAAAARRAVDEADEAAGPRPGPLAAVEGR